MLSLRKFVLGFGALALLCTPAFAQGQGRGFGGGMGGGPQMLNNPSVQKELKFTEEQTSKAQTAMTEIRDAHQDEMAALRDLDPAERDAYRALARESARLTGRPGPDRRAR